MQKLRDGEESFWTIEFLEKAEREERRRLAVGDEIPAHREISWGIS